MDDRDLQAKVQVCAELSLRDQIVQRLVRRGDDPNVAADRFVSADPLERPVLKHAQQLGLRGERHVADLVEEQRSAVARFEPTDASPRRPR